MATMREIKQRIKSVNSTKQITKAMNLVSAAKLQQARGKLEQVRPYFNETQTIISTILKYSEILDHPYFTIREGKKKAYIVLTADRGLCGGYNANVFKELLTQVQGEEDISIFSVGKKGKDFFQRQDYHLLAEYQAISEDPTYSDAAKIGELAIQLYNEGTIDELHLVYTSFVSTIQHEPVTLQLLPLDPDVFVQETKEKAPLMRYEPSAETVLGYIIPKYVNSLIYGGLVEASASEQGARMTAMDTATENANTMIEDLTLAYNRARQATITQELSEIVGGAEALQ
ncbi:MAG: ATP synthase F1 subunit gamma [Epulopiscium sp.]|nr:ATP synthase F1 subunit gamma [Candidatus Epulonipiscium sp.]